MDRVNIPAMDELLGVAIPILNDGHIMLVDYMGNDQSIVQAARVSYGAGTKKVSEDRGLIRYLLRHRHTTPFEMCELKIRVRVPMDCWRQWIRHRTASVNEYSTRYSEAIDGCQTTDPKAWRLQSGTNKQGSTGFVGEQVGEHLSAAEAALHTKAREVYDFRLHHGVAREQARKDLPLSNWTEAYWKIDLHNLLGFLRLRCDSHAQYEIRQYANAIRDHFLKPWLPIVYEAFVDYGQEGVFLTGPEKRLIVSIIGARGPNSGYYDLVDDFKNAGFLFWKNDTLVESREMKEFRAKLTKLGIPNDWWDHVKSTSKDDGRACY